MLLGPGPVERSSSGGIGLLVGQQPHFFDIAPGETASDIADRESDEAIRELHEAQNVTMSEEDTEF